MSVQHSGDDELCPWELNATHRQKTCPQSASTSGSWRHPLVQAVAPLRKCRTGISCERRQELAGWSEIETNWGVATDWDKLRGCNIATARDGATPVETILCARESEFWDWLKWSWYWWILILTCTFFWHSQMLWTGSKITLKIRCLSTCYALTLRAKMLSW